MEISTYVKPSDYQKILTYSKEFIAYVIPNIDIGINGFLFDVVGEEVVTMESDITDYWVEDGSPAQDNIALRPIIFKMKGKISEVKFQPQQIYKVKPEIEAKLKDIEDFKPSLNQSAQNYITGKLATATNPIKTSSLYEQIKKINVISVTKQKLVMFYLQILRDNRVLSTIQTPWRIYTSMAMQALSATQSEENKEITEFEITFKQINYTKTLQSGRAGSGRNQILSTNEVDVGITSGLPVSNSSVV